MKRVFRIGMAVFLLSLVVCAVVEIQNYRHCQFTAGGDRWREQQQLKLGYDPCDENAPQPWLYRVAPLTLVLSSIVTLGAGVGVAVVSRRSVV